VVDLPTGQYVVKAQAVNCIAVNVLMAIKGGETARGG
jgi:hypothetical protein